MALPPLFDKLRLPAVGAPQFIISNPDLVIAQCKAGIVGAFPALNARPQPLLDDWLVRIKDELAAYDEANPHAPSAPYAVNQIVHRSNERLEADVATCVKHKVPIVITSLGARPEVNDAIHSYGGIILHDIINITFAKKALGEGRRRLDRCRRWRRWSRRCGLSPIALIHEIREFFDGPLCCSQARSHRARGILAAQAMGADLGYMGSAFIATTEANALTSLQTDDRRLDGGRHHLLEPLYRRARQLSEAVHRQRRPRSGQSRRQRSNRDEVRRKRLEGESLEGHLGRRPRRWRRARDCSPRPISSRA